MKLISGLFPFLLAASFTLSLNISHAQTNIYRDPGTGPVVPWPLDFPRDPLHENEFLGTWKSSKNHEENLWVLSLSTTSTPGIYHWELVYPRAVEATISGVGQVTDNILIGYWRSAFGSDGAITVHMLSGKVYVKVGSSKDRLFEQTFDQRERPATTK